MEIGSNAATAVQGAAPPAHHGHHRPRLSGTAELLGMSEKDMAAAHRSGTTLVDLAQAKGISKDDLIKSIAADLKADPRRGPQPTDDQLTQMATNIAEGKRPGRGHHGRRPDHDGDDMPPPSPAGTPAASPFTRVASALGMQENELLTALEGGATLPDIASQHGSSISSLVDLFGKSTGTAVDTTV